MTKEKLQEKLTQLAAQKDQTIAQMNALAGAQQILEQILAEWEEPDHASTDQPAQ